MKDEFSPIYFDDVPIKLLGDEARPPLSRVVRAGGQVPGRVDVLVLTSRKDTKGHILPPNEIIDRTVEPSKPIFLRSRPRALPGPAAAPGPAEAAASGPATTAPLAPAPAAAADPVAGIASGRAEPPHDRDPVIEQLGTAARYLTKDKDGRPSTPRAAPDKEAAPTPRAAEAELAAVAEAALAAAEAAAEARQEEDREQEGEIQDDQEAERDARDDRDRDGE